MPEQKYPFLRDVFETFVLLKTSKYKDQESVIRSLEPFQEFNHLGKRSFYDELGLDAKTVYETYVAPWEKLKPEQMTQIAKIWNLQFGLLNDVCLESSVVFSYPALHWTMVNVHALNAFEVFQPNYRQELENTPVENWDWITHLFIAGEYSLPYKQCFYCGRLEQDARGNAFKENRPFSFCHATDCDMTDPNPNAHGETCCYAVWKRLKNKVHRSFERHKLDQQSVISLFKEFCDERYEANKRLVIPVRPKKQKPGKWKTIYD